MSLSSSGIRRKSTVTLGAALRISSTMRGRRKRPKQLLATTLIGRSAAAGSNSSRGVEHAVEIVEDAVEHGEQLGAAVGRDEMGAAPDEQRIAGDLAELPEREADRRLALPGAGRRPRNAGLAEENLPEPHQAKIERTFLCRDLHDFPPPRGERSARVRLRALPASLKHRPCQVGSRAPRLRTAPRSGPLDLPSR